MITVIGGSPGSGTSLLANILNRHGEVVCGPETSLFSRPQLIIHWPKYKSLLYGKHIRKLRNPGWHRYYGTDLLNQFYRLPAAQLRQLVENSSDFIQFSRRLSNLIRTRHGKSLWFEKTPGNVSSFHFLAQLPEYFRTILMVRNPYDTIASLCDRGFSIPYATASYLLNVSAGLSAKHANLITIKYEELVTKPESVLNKLCLWSGIEFQKEMLISDDKVVQMKGWLNNEYGPISPSGVRRFERMNQEIQDGIIGSVAQMRIKPSFDLYGIPFHYSSIEEICADLDYAHKSPGRTGSVPSSMKQELVREKMLRTLKGYRTHMFNFPIEYQ